MEIYVSGMWFQTLLWECSWQKVTQVKCLIDINCRSVAVVSDKIATTFNRSGAIRVVALNIFNAFGRVWHGGILHKRKSYRF